MRPLAGVLGLFPEQVQVLHQWRRQPHHGELSSTSTTAWLFVFGQLNGAAWYSFLLCRVQDMSSNIELS